MMSPRCSTCGAYFTSNEAFCQRCGTQRFANPYPANPYQAQPNQANPYQAQPPNQGVYGAGNVNAQQNWMQNYFTPQRIVRRWVIGRLIAYGILLCMFLACMAYCLLAGGLAALTQH